MGRRFLSAAFLMSFAIGLTSDSFTAKLHPAQERKTIPIAAILKREGSAVIMIDIRDDRGQPTGQASGVIIRTNGIIATNFHVIEGACDLRVVISAAKVAFPVSSVLAVDTDDDIAVLRVAADRLPVATVGDSSRTHVGERVVAIGNPMGLEKTVSEGIVSGIRGGKQSGWLQITAPISPGSSGGGLYNMHGELIGLTSFTFRESQNLNFAVPIEKVVQLLRSPEGGPVEIPWQEAAAKLSLCRESAQVVDSPPLLAILGRPISDPAVEEVLRKLNRGRDPVPIQRFFSKLVGGDIENYSFPNLGVNIILKNGSVSFLTLHGFRPTEKSGPFQGTLPFDLAWGMSRTQVSQILGPPVEGHAMSSVQGVTPEMLSRYSWKGTWFIGDVQCGLSFDNHDELVEVSLTPRN